MLSVASVPSGSCDVSLRGETNSLPISRHDTRKCGTTSSPWKILAPRFGQRLNVTLVHLSNNASYKEVQTMTTTAMTSAGCQSYVTIREPLRHASRDVCIRRSVREYSIYLSESETIELEMSVGGNVGGYLMIISGQRPIFASCFRLSHVTSFSQSSPSTLGFLSRVCVCACVRAKGKGSLVALNSIPKQSQHLKFCIFG